MDRQQPDPEQVAQTSRRILYFGLLTLAAMVCTTLPFPWRASTALVAFGAVGYGIYTALRAWKAGMQGGTTMLLGIGIALAGMLGFMSLASLAAWPAEMDREQCLAGALTIQAKEACETAYQQQLTSLLPSGG